MKILSVVVLLLSVLSSSAIPSIPSITSIPSIPSSNNCLTFSVGSGTGCQWMCNYCANGLGTNNYYFTDGVCTYQSGGCVGNPVVGKEYTCCAVSKEKEL